ncbi:SAM-dependent methyltransferase [uncultured Enterococcus sp.]|uniref:SAM-dependent methyltransferase n=1 Tax=uncultured Enterococcus sp. TaxID=167972 RepID=UPI0025D5D627|nr:cyclopropane-fatty-acyl-phospholipid synthase family protein [uncultured Enterococcus sp.]
MLEKELYKKLFSESFSLPVAVNYWDNTSERYGNLEGEPEITITFNEIIPIKEITKNASLTLGEAYMDKKIEIDGSIQALVTDAYRQANSFLRSKSYIKWLPKLARHTKKQNKEDIHSHYDLGNEFYELWLDKTLTYSCAYFQTPEDTLEQAQMNKVRHILNKLFIKEGDSLLDIGCGWGTLMFTAIKEYGVHATGITLSEEQYRFITDKIKAEGLEDQCTVLLKDYREVKNMEFDHITSVGMFEHVGEDSLEEYFAVVKRLLKPKGTALIHGISRQQGGATNAWINQYIFPGGYIPGVAELANHMQTNDLQLIDLESLRRDYQLTLEHWAHNFHEVKEQVLQVADERFYRMWDLYLQACAASFEASNIDVVQYLLVHPGNNSIPMHRYVGH